jgi:signal transduction histidine kinase
MLPIRRYLLKELAVTFGVMALALLLLAGISILVPSTNETGGGIARILFLIGAVMLFLAFSIWRIRNLAKRFGDPLEALAESVRSLSEGRIPETVNTDLKEIHSLSEALRRAGESLQNEAELRSQLERSQRMETMGALAGGVAHDVNNQLASIVGQINLGKEMLPENHPVRRRLNKAEDAADRCALMIKSLLSFTHQVKPQLRSVDLNTLIANTASMMDRILGGLIRIELDLMPDLPPVLGEPIQLEQILFNLAVNARDAMPQGGRLTLRTEPEDTNQICWTVQDSGTGIVPDVLPHIFEPFFTTKPLGKGSGLGLAMVQSIVDAHGGRIEVNSQPGKGTEFRIFLNIYEEESATEEETPRATLQPKHFAGKRILVAEDDPNLRELLADAFTQARAQVETAPDGRIAWSMFQQSRYDLVISDQRMPECTGLELLAKIRKAQNTIPVILVSGYGLEGMEEELKKDSRLRFFFKPFSIRALFATASELLSPEFASRIAEQA